MATMMIILGVILMVVFCALTAFTTYVWLQLKLSRDAPDDCFDDYIIGTHAEYFNEYLDESRPINKNKAE